MNYETAAFSRQDLAYIPDIMDDSNGSIGDKKRLNVATCAV